MSLYVKLSCENKINVQMLSNISLHFDTQKQREVVIFMSPKNMFNYFVVLCKEQIFSCFSKASKILI